MDSLILPFRRGRKEREEKKERLKRGIGSDISLKHKAQSRIRAADIEFERAFAEVMGLGREEKKTPEKAFSEPKKVVIIGKKKNEKEKKGKKQKEKEKKKEIRKLLKKEKQARPKEKAMKKPGGKKRVRARQKKKAKKEKKPKEEKIANPPKEKKPEAKPEDKKRGITKAPEKKMKAKKWAVFNFWYSDKKASSLQEFKDAISTISEQSLEHHAGHNDFSKYLREFYNESAASRVEALERTLKGSELRKRILKEL